MCKLFATHNHSLSSAAALSRYPVAEETNAQLKQLYTEGMKSNAALKKLKENLSPYQLADRSIAPDYKYANQ